MKEEVVAIESTQQLSTERARLQLEKYQLEQSRSEVERKNCEISELQQKVSPSALNFKKDFHFVKVFNYRRNQVISGHWLIF